MKIYQIALMLFIYSAVVTLFNTVGIFDDNLVSPGAQVNTSEINGVFEINQDGTVASRDDWIDETADSFGLNFIVSVALFMFNFLQAALDVGKIVSDIVPGTVGTALRVMIDSITWAVYGWGAAQLWRKTPTKGMD